MHLLANITSLGVHAGGWRLPQSDPQAFVKVSHYVEMARIAEAARFDAVFLADGPVLSENVRHRAPRALEPTVLLTALAMATERVGLIATASTTFNEPYNLARRFASVDHVSGGRTGWNVVTTSRTEAAGNFGTDGLPEHDARYERAEEFVDVVRALWESWEPDAYVGDKEHGLLVDDDLVHRIDHAGAHFAVAGPLNVPRTPQDHPVIVQAGTSDQGRALAARHADLVYAAQPTLERAREYYDDIKARAAAFGRDPESVRVIPGILPILGSTDAEAAARERELASLVSDEYTRELLADRLEVELAALDLDSELPDAFWDDLERIRGSRGQFAALADVARRGHLTPRQLAATQTTQWQGLRYTGNPDGLADLLETWHTAGAADGFVVLSSVVPDDLRAFADHVVPRLQARGLARSEYSGTTLRDHLGVGSRSATASRVAHAKESLRPTNSESDGDGQSLERRPALGRVERVGDGDHLVGQ